MAYAWQREQAKTAACRADMVQLENAEKSHVALDGSARPSMQTPVDDHLLERAPRCPDRGAYSWASDVDGDVELTCSVHGGVSGGSITPVASSFSATTGSLIALMLNYYAQHGSWRRSWLPYCYADLGLARRKIRAVGPGPPPAGTVSRQAPFQDPQTSTAVPG